MSIHIDVSTNPTEEDRLAILEPLKRFNAEQAGDGKSEKVAMFIRDDQTREVLGGLHARILYEWLFIELLVVPEQARGQGMGSRLMQMAEDLAVEKGCTGIWLDTFDFRAPISIAATVTPSSARLTTIRPATSASFPEAPAEHKGLRLTSDLELAHQIVEGNGQTRQFPA